MIFESYIGNRDWPNNNVRFFAVKDGPFRFIMFDLDLVSTTNIDDSPLDFINTSVENPITDLFNIMYANQEFKTRYDARFNELMTSGILNSARFNETVSSHQSNIEHIMPTQIQKFKTPETYTDWYFNVEKLKENFQAREDFVN